MKLQGMTIVYVIIIIPILIVISLTLNGYKEQLNNNLKYDTDLTGAVNDAIIAFELNSSSQDFSNVSDNFTSLVDASVNIFRRSIATRLNMTNADEALMNKYFPLALFTGYSGYYIYSPTYAPVVVRNPYTGQAAFSSDVEGNDLDINTGTYSPDINSSNESLQYTPVLLKHKDHINDGTGDVRVTTDKSVNNSSKAKQEIDYSLKQMIPYTLNLKQNDNNHILLNFTLDNYISFTGKIDGIPYNKSGYLLDHDTSIELKRGATTLYKLNKITDRLPIDHLYSYDEYVDKYIDTELTKGNNNLILTVKEYDEIGFKEVNIEFNPSLYRSSFQDFVASKNTQMTGEYAYQKQQLDAIKYYIKAANFSNFVYKHLSNYTEEHIIDLVSENQEIQDKYSKYFLPYDRANNEKIFITDSNKRISDYSSTFNEVKRKAIRNSVQYDLIISTINYNYLVSSSEFILKLPVITDEDWDRIIQNISFTAFLQGLPIGGGNKFNNYAISTSTMNNFIINPETIFFVHYKGFNKGLSTTLDEAENNNEDLFYHKINCTDFIKYLNDEHKDDNDMGSATVGYKMSEFIYDARWSREEAKYIYDHKNYSHFNCIINNNLKRKDKMSNEEIMIMEKTITAAVAAEKERAFKPNKIVNGDGFIVNLNGSLNHNVKHNIKAFEISTVNKENKTREYTIKLGNKSISKTVNSSTVKFPTLDYNEYKSFIENLKKSTHWDKLNLNNVEIDTNEEIEYIKIRYF